MEGGRLLQATKEMKTYNISILGLSETRWTGYGEVDLQEGEKFIYSGRENEDNRHQEGVGFILSKKAKQSMINWKPVSS
jgi:hypothetical protein